MRVQITLRSGAQIEVDVVSIDLTSQKRVDEATKEHSFQYVAAQWEHPEVWTSRLVGVVPQEIAAVVQLADKVEEVQ